MSTVKVISNQSLVDIAVQEYGTAEGIFQLMRDNPGVITSLDADLSPGTELVISDTPEAVNQEVETFFRSTNTSIATGQGASGGIGYWVIETNFIVS